VVDDSGLQSAVVFTRVVRLAAGSEAHRFGPDVPLLVAAPSQESSRCRGRSSRVRGFGGRRPRMRSAAPEPPPSEPGPAPSSAEPRARTRGLSAAELEERGRRHRGDQARVYGGLPQGGPAVPPVTPAISRSPSGRVQKPTRGRPKPRSRLQI